MPSTAHVRTHNNNNNNNNMSFDRGRRIFSLTCTGKHGIMSLYLVIILLSAAIPWAAAQPGSSNNNNSDPYQYSRFTPSMAIIIAVLITALFFMGFFSVYIRQCSEAQSTNPNTVRGRGMSRRGAAARGLDASVIETFPTLVYSVVKGLKIGKSALECAVCLSEFEDHETLRLIPKCDHVFHPECIDEWLSSHTTCPVCRANLVPQPGDSVPTLTELHPECSDLEAQILDPNHQNVEHEQGEEREEHEILNVNQTLKRNRTRGSRSGRARIFQFQLPFPRSHSTGHSLVQPGESTERFTLRLPVEVRKKIMNQKLNRAMSMVVLPREGSSRRGYRTGGEGSGRGKSHMRFEKSDRAGKSDPWVFSMTPPFFMRESSFKLLKVVANDGEGTSAQPVRPEGSTSNSVRPPV